MRSIGARLTFWYAVCATVSFATLSLIGSRLVEARLVHGLDELNAAEFRQLKAHIGPDYASLSPLQLEQRLANVNSYESVLFYIGIEDPSRKQTVFNSSNLHGQRIPDVKGKRKFDADAPGHHRLSTGRSSAINVWLRSHFTSARSEPADKNDEHFFKGRAILKEMGNGRAPMAIKFPLLDARGRAIGAV